MGIVQARELAQNARQLQQTMRDLDDEAVLSAAALSE